MKYHCLEHLDPKFVEKFYKKIIHNEFCADTPDPFKNKAAKLEPDEPDEPDESEEEIESEEVIKPPVKAPKKTVKVEKI